jgi:hypothetical protein
MMGQGLRGDGQRGILLLLLPLLLLLLVVVARK